MKNPGKVIQNCFVNQFDNPKNNPKNAIVKASSIFPNVESMKNPMKKKSHVEILVTIKFRGLLKKYLLISPGISKNTNRLIPRVMGKNSNAYFNTIIAE